MTRQKRLVTFGVSLACVAAGIALFITAQTNAQQSRPDLWKKVAEADAKGLPRTGIAAVEPIIESAMKDKAYPEAIKAIGPPTTATTKRTRRAARQDHERSAARGAAKLRNELS